MPNFKLAKAGEICLIQQSEDGRIMQIAMTLEQNNLLQILLASLSKNSPLIRMGEEFDLVLKSSLCIKCKKQ